jgi:hypothetical protein
LNSAIARCPEIRRFSLEIVEAIDLPILLMIPYKTKRHKSATSIVREFLGPQLAVVPEELVWIPAHPSYPDDGGFTYDEMLKAVRKQNHWAFVRVPHDKTEAVIHFWATKQAALTDVARMLGHELGHISGDILDDDTAEEARADRYGAVAEHVIKMLSQKQKSKTSTSRAGKPSRQARASGKQSAVSRASSIPPIQLVQVRKKKH